MLPSRLLLSTSTNPTFAGDPDPLPPNTARIALLHNRHAFSLSQVRECAVYPYTSLELECAHAFPGQRDVNQGSSSGGRTGLLVVLMPAFPTIGIAAYAYRTKRQVSERARLPSVLHMTATSFHHEISDNTGLSSTSTSPRRNVIEFEVS